jgi:hypothetical protein
VLLAKAAAMQHCSQQEAEAQPMASQQQAAPAAAAAAAAAPPSVAVASVARPWPVPCDGGSHQRRTYARDRALPAVNPPADAAQVAVAGSR